MKRTDKEILLELMRDPEKQRKYYLRFKGGADLLAADIYREILAPLGW